LRQVGEFFEGSNRPVQTAAFRFEFGQNPWDIQRGFSSVTKFLPKERHRWTNPPFLFRFPNKTPTTATLRGIE
jgi:hypothetical protein